MIKPVWNWILNFDSLKGIFLAIFAILGSWYDMKGQLKLNTEAIEQNRIIAQQNVIQLRQETEHRLQDQEKMDVLLASEIKDLKMDIKDGFKDLKAEMRSRR